jgi:hypothetical protein
MPRMKTRRRFLTTPHQRQRLALWALSLLQWIAAVLFGGKSVNLRQLRQRYERVSLDRLTRLAIDLLLVRAGELAGRRPRKRRYWRHGRDLRARHLIRSLLGSNLRRALKPKDVSARIAALVGVLRDIDRYARRLARRMRRGLARLWAIITAPMPAKALDDASAAPQAFADSS